MAIEIIDGFKVSSAVPVDNRIVASGSTDRNAITYKYEGLRVFDTSDSIPYVWLNNTWEKENKTALTVPSTVIPGFTNTTSYRAGQILKVYNSNKLLTNSNMFEVEFLNSLGNITFRTIAINHLSPSSVSSSAILDVNGNIKANTFVGSGANITNIDPANFNTSTNKIQTNQIANGTSGFILQTVDDGLGNLSIQWKNPSSIISPSSVSTSIEATQPTLHYLTFVSTTSGSNLLVYKNTATQVIGVIPSVGQIVVKSDSTPSTPPYSFIDEPNTGIYKSGVGSVSVSILGNKKIEIDTNGLKVIKGDAINPGISIGASNYGIYQSNTSNNRIGIVVASNEMIRIKSSSTQGNGNTTFYGEGNVLSIQGNTHAYMEFYRSGSATPDVSANRSAYIGFPSSGANNLIIYNEVKNTYIDLASNGSINIQSSLSGFATEIKNTLGLGLVVRSSHSTGGGECLRLYGRPGVNYISLYDGLSSVKTFVIGHTNAINNNNIILNHELPTGVISTLIGGVSKFAVNTNGVTVGVGTTMKSIYHGWFYCTYNTGGAGITYTDLNTSGLGGNGFTYATGAATGGTSPAGFISFTTPAFTSINKVIVQVTPRYGGVSQYMIFSAEVTTTTNIRIYFKTPYQTVSSLGWDINNFAFNISIFEIVQ